MNAHDLTRFAEVPLEVEVLIPCNRMRIRELLALEAGSVVQSDRLAGENVDVMAGGAPLGIGELTKMGGRLVVRILSFREGD